MKILLTGNLGFIASHLCRLLLASGYEVIGLDLETYAANKEVNKEFLISKRYSYHKGSICSFDLLEYLHKKYGFDLIINMAGETHNDRSLLFPKHFLDTNVIGTFMILELCRKYDIKLLHMSTDECIKHLPPTNGNFNDCRVKEESSVYAPSSPYSSTKASAELLCNAYRKSYKLDVTVVRSVNVMGPSQNSEKLIPRVIAKGRAGEKVPVFKTRAWRDWCYVEDLCRALKLLVETEAREDLYHISAYNETETLDMVKMILNLIGKDESCIEMVEDRKAYDLYYSLDSSKIRALGWKPQVSLEEGLALTVKSYMNDQV